MSKQQIIENLISTAPDKQLDIIIAFIQFVLNENNEYNNALLSEPSLSRYWMQEEEDTAWQDL